MPNKHSKSYLLIFGFMLIALSVAVFLFALLIEQNIPFSGLSRILVVTAFGLMASLATGLLILVSRTARPGPESLPAFSNPPKELQPVPVDAAGPDEPQSEPLAAEQAESPALESSKLLADTAEELRTSVDAMQEELEEMMVEESAADKDRIESLYDETDRITRIIDGMEALAKAKKAGQSLQKSVIELNPFLSGIVDQVRQTTRPEDISVTLECEQNLLLAADQDHLRKIILNLLENAAKAVYKSGTISLSAMIKDGEVLLVIRDTGKGIKSRDLSHIFEPFYRGSGSGLGLGLALAKELVNAHGGKITVETRVGKGSAFTIHLPSE